MRDIPSDRPVFIQAYISKDVPRSYVQTRENVLAFLREFDAAGGNRVHLIVHETEPYTTRRATRARSSASSPWKFPRWREPRRA